MFKECGEQMVYNLEFAACHLKCIHQEFFLVIYISMYLSEQYYLKCPRIGARNNISYLGAYCSWRLEVKQERLVGCNPVPPDVHQLFPPAPSHSENVKFKNNNWGLFYLLMCTTLRKTNLLELIPVHVGCTQPKTGEKCFLNSREVP